MRVPVKVSGGRSSLPEKVLGRAGSAPCLDYIIYYYFGYWFYGGCIGMVRTPHQLAAMQESLCRMGMRVRSF